MTIKSHTHLELQLKAGKLEAEATLIKLYNVVLQAPDLTIMEREEADSVTKALDATVKECYDLLTNYLVDEESTK